MVVGIYRTRDGGFREKEVEGVEWVRQGGSPSLSSTTCPAEADGAVWLSHAAAVAF